ncbi:hypothetical protein CAJAP_03895 [Camponotus japonicus]
MIEENVPSTSMFSISFDFKEILGSHEQVGEREGEGETRQRVATIVEAFREFRQLKSTDDRMAVARGSGALQALRRKSADIHRRATLYLLTIAKGSFKSEPERHIIVYFVNPPRSRLRYLEHPVTRRSDRMVHL